MAVDLLRSFHQGEGAKKYFQKCFGTPPAFAGRWGDLLASSRGYHSAFFLVTCAEYVAGSQTVGAEKSWSPKFATCSSPENWLYSRFAWFSFLSGEGG